MHKIYEPLDPHIAPVVMLLREKGYNTFTSCDGGEGHAFQMPTVRIEPAPVKTAGGLATVAHAIAGVLLRAGYRGFYAKVVLSYGGHGRRMVDCFIEVEFWAGPPAKETNNG